MDTTTQYYDQNAAAFAEGTQQLDMSDFYQKFLKYIPQTGTILDAGCGAGRDTKFFLNLGFEVEAIDASLELCNIASCFTGIQVKHLRFDQIDRSSRFDGIWACASLLHIPSNELPHTLDCLLSCLKPAGVMYSSFKLGNYEGERNGRYFTDLTLNSFQKILPSHVKVVNHWITSDIRLGRAEERWLNTVVQKVH